MSQQRNFITSGLPFGHAINAMKQGWRAQRAGWNGKDMWIAIHEVSNGNKMTLPYIYMSTVSGDLVPWLASQTDMLAEDWRIFQPN